LKPNVVDSIVIYSFFIIIIIAVVIVVITKIFERFYYPLLNAHSLLGVVEATVDNTCPRVHII